MAKSAAKPAKQGPFDLEKLRELLEMMEKYELMEISLKNGDEEWQLKRGGGLEQVQMVPAAPLPVAAVPQAVVAPPASEPVAAAKAELPADIAEIKSPTVGTFYTAPSPEDPAFVEVGARVQADTIVCIVEAMKVFNQIPAEISGTISEALVANGDAVEFGQPLYRIRLN